MSVLKLFTQYRTYSEPITPLRFIKAEKYTHNVCCPVNIIPIVRSLIIQLGSDSDLSLISLAGIA